MGFGKAIYEHFRFGKYDSADAKSLRNTYNSVLRETPESERYSAQIQSDMQAQMKEMTSLKNEIAELKRKLAEKDG